MTLFNELAEAIKLMSFSYVLRYSRKDLDDDIVLT